MAVFYDIVPLSITTDDDSDYSAKVKTQSATLEDVAATVLNYGNEYTKETLLAVYSHMENAIREMVISGYSITTDNVIYIPKIKGKFDKSGSWDADTNYFSCSLYAAQTFRDELTAVTPSFTGYVNSSGGAQIETITDNITGLTDGSLTLGGVVTLTGTNIKVTGDGSGIWFIATDDDGNYDSGGETTEVGTIVSNDPSKVVFMMPTALTEGYYYIVIKTLYTKGGTLLKSLRTIITDSRVSTG